MVVIGDDNLEVIVIVDIADADIQSITAITVMTLPVAIGIPPVTGKVVVSRPGGLPQARGLERRSVRRVYKHLGAAVLGALSLGGRGDHFYQPVAI